MLAKLIKYDLRYCLRKFWIIWAGLLALSALNGLSLRYTANGGEFKGILGFFLGALPVIMITVLGVALGVLILVFICERFYKGLLGDEGYLMFTLPVTSAQHIVSKTVVALILQLISAVVGLACAAVILSVANIAGLRYALRAAMEQLRALQWPAGTAWLIVEYALVCLVGVVVNTLHIYVAIALGHLARKHRAGYAVLAYFLISAVLSFLSVAGLQAGLPGLTRWWAGMQFYVDAQGIHGSVGALAQALGVGFLLAAVQGAAFFFVTRWTLDKKLNLE